MRATGLGGASNKGIIFLGDALLQLSKIQVVFVDVDGSPDAGVVAPYRDDAERADALKMIAPEVERHGFLFQPGGRFDLEFLAGFAACCVVVVGAIGAIETCEAAGRTGELECHLEGRAIAMGWGRSPSFLLVYDSCHTV